MKGVMYNLSFTNPAEQKTEFSNLLILDLMKTIETNIDNEYKLKMKVTRNMIYNLVHRPNKANRFVRQFCKIFFTDKKDDSV